MIGWLFVTLGVAFASALLPLISVEVFVIGLASSNPSIPWLAIGAAVAVGQVAGKLPYYLAAKGSIHLPKTLHDRLHRERISTPRRERWRVKLKWLHDKLDLVRERCHQYPLWMNITYGVSAVIGIPPYMATTVLAGFAGMRMPLFLSVGVVGRWVRYSALAASPAIFASWLHF